MDSEAGKGRVIVIGIGPGEIDQMTFPWQKNNHNDNAPGGAAVCAGSG